MTMDLPSPDRPKSASNPENIKNLEKIVMKDRRLKLSELAKEMDIPKTTIYRMLTEDLGMKNVSARWVPKLLSPLQKRDRVAICNENLDLIEENRDMLTTLITGDETWVYYFDPETKQQSMQWKHRGSHPQGKQKSKNLPRS